MRQLGFGKALLLLTLLVCSSTAMLAYSQLGEVAGGQDFNVTLGGTATSNTFTIVNAGNQSIGFIVKLPQFNVIPNATVPNVTITPMNGTIPPHSNYKLNITVYVPVDHNKAGDRWDGLIQVLQTLPAGSGVNGGAVIETGVGKEIIITAKPEVYNWPLIGLGVLVVVVIVVVAYKKLKERRRPSARSGRASKLSAMVNGPRKRTTRGRRAARGRKKGSRRRRR